MCLLLIAVDVVPGRPLLLLGNRDEFHARASAAAAPWPDVPGVFGGLSVGIGVAWICVISAEMISGRLGVGYRTWQAYTVLAYPDVFVGIITIGVLGFVTSAAVELLGLAAAIQDDTAAGFRGRRRACASRRCWTATW